MHEQALRRMRAARASQPIAFEPNAGQAGKGIQFLARGLDCEFALDRAGGLREITGGEGPMMFSLAAGNPRPRIVRGSRLPGTVSYPAAGSVEQRVLPTFERVRYQDVYDGVDIDYHSAKGQLEYDFSVAPGARVEAIRLRFPRTQTLSIEAASGDLLVTGADGSAVRHTRPRLYLDGDPRTTVEGGYALVDPHTVGFVAARYDHRRRLIIDPTILMTQYIRGSGHDLPVAIAVDASGNSYITGTTDSASGWPNGDASQVSNFPGCTSAVHDGLTCRRAFLMKLSSARTILGYSIWGGTGDTWPNAIALDSTNVYVAGASNSPDVSGIGVSAGGRYDAATPAGGMRAFVARFSLTTLQPSLVTTLGGGGDGSEAYGLAVGAAKNLYVTGSTCGAGFPTSEQFQHQALQAAFAGGICDGFVAKIDPSGLLDAGYSTYLGGEGFDSGNAITVDGSGSAWITGQTCSSGFPVTDTRTDHGVAGPYKSCTAFITKLDPSGLLLGSMLLGGHPFSDNLRRRWGAFDWGNAIVLNGTNGVYVGGLAESPNFYTVGAVMTPVTPCVTTSTPRYCSSGFIASIDSGFNIIYSTYFGGPAPSNVTSIGRNTRGEIYVGGWIQGERGFPGAPANAPNVWAGYLSKLPASLSTVSWSQFSGVAVQGLAIQPSASRVIIPVLTDTTIYTTGNFTTPAYTAGDALEDGFVQRTSDPVLVVVSP